MVVWYTATPLAQVLPSDRCYLRTGTFLNGSLVYGYSPYSDATFGQVLPSDRCYLRTGTFLNGSLVYGYSPCSGATFGQVLPSDRCYLRTGTFLNGSLVYGYSPCSARVQAFIEDPKPRPGSRSTSTQRHQQSGEQTLSRREPTIYRTQPSTTDLLNQRRRIYNFHLFPRPPTTKPSSYQHDHRRNYVYRLELRRRRCSVTCTAVSIGSDSDDSFTEKSGYLFELSATEADSLADYNISKITAIYFRKPLVVARRLFQTRTAFGKWFGLRYLDARFDCSDDMFQVRSAELRKILVELGPAYIKIV
ncbi:hypothetical protein KIW84_030778 [Lathyrus oleraceus]|uniref:Uncharacterized protein n=1 Tax=Pisum sativum TaxID=3888 RepID=A0A9D5AWN9_PEA|nr:hypothetical protein KIW84_030778 [Pisum sativum]